MNQIQVKNLDEKNKILFRDIRWKWVETEDNSRGKQKVNCQIKSKTEMLTSCLCNCRDTWIFVNVLVNCI